MRPLLVTFGLYGVAQVFYYALRGVDLSGASEWAMIGLAALCAGAVVIVANWLCGYYRLD